MPKAYTERTVVISNHANCFQVSGGFHWFLGSRKLGIYWSGFSAIFLPLANDAISMTCIRADEQIVDLWARVCSSSMVSALLPYLQLKIVNDISKCKWTMSVFSNLCFFCPWLLQISIIPHIITCQATALIHS